MTGYDGVGLVVSATNQGAVPVTLSSVVIEMPRVDQTLVIVRWILQSPADLPHLLTSGESWTGLADLDDLARKVASLARGRPPWKVRISVKDAAGRKYEAPRLPIEPPTIG